ncbi:MAG: DUF3857 domain-containing protein [Calditrichaeota bacterium]|nr:DUF3857 domain-containing protein [Calditrichota bacterium]
MQRQVRGLSCKIGQKCYYVHMPKGKVSVSNSLKNIGMMGTVFMKFRKSIAGLVALFCAVIACNLWAQTDPLRPLIDAAGDAKKYPDAAAVVVFDSTIIRMEPSGLSHVVSRTLTKILTPEGIKNFRSLRFDYDPASNLIEVNYARVHRKDGKVEEVSLSALQDLFAPADLIRWGGRMKLLALPTLEVGDAMEVETYKKGFQIAYLWQPTEEDERYIPPMRGHFYDVVLFGGKYPMVEKAYVLRVPKDKPAQFEVYNGEVFSSFLFEGDHLLYTFWKKDIEPISEEDRQPDPPDFVTKVVLATVKDWPEKSRWFFETNEPIFDMNDDIQAKVNEITRGLPTDSLRVAAILHWSAQNIRYSGITMGKGEGYTIHPSTMTFRDRCGVCKDIAGMCVGMLRAAGYTVYPAMTMAGARVEHIPADQFNHCVVALKKPDGSFWMIDPTWAAASRDIWSLAEGEQHYVIGSPEGEDRAAIRTFKAEESQTRVTARWRAKPNGDLLGTIHARGTGYGDTRLRRAVGDTPLAEQRRMIEDWLLKVSPAARLKSYTVTDPLNFHKDVELTMEVELPGYACADRNYFTLTSPASKLVLGAQRPFNLTLDLKEEERKTPALLWATREIYVDEQIEPPPGMRFVAGSDSAVAQGDIASFRQVVSDKGGRFKNESLYRLTKRTIEPDDFDELIAAQKLMKKQAQAVWTFRGGKS